MSVFKQGDCIIYNADMRDVMPALGECADLIMTDPPYRLTSGGKDTGEMGGCFSHGEYDNSGSIVECDIDWPDFIPLLYGSLRGDSHAYIMANNRNVQPMLNEAEKSGFRFHNLCVWDKGTATPNRWYMKNLEFVGFFYKGTAKHINDCGSKQLIYVQQEDYGNHPTTKPVGLMEYYISNSSTQGQTVCDPFCGTASTAIAALRSGRKFIGVESDKRWFGVACDRVMRFLDGPKQASLI